MKIISLLFLTLFLGKGCDGQTKLDMSTAKIEYNAVSRGFYKKVWVENQIAFVSNNRDEKPIETKLSEQQWKTLCSEFQKLHLDSIPNLKAPSEKRFHDGAAIADLKIIYKGKTYESQSFDNGFPPDDIKKLVETVLSFTKTKE